MLDTLNNTEFWIVEMVAIVGAFAVGVGLNTFHRWLDRKHSRRLQNSFDEAKLKESEK